MKKINSYIIIFLFVFFISLPGIVDASEALPAPSLDLCFYYSQLNEKEQNVYLQTMEEVMQTTTTFAPCEEFSPDSIIRVVNAVVMDQPQLFWLEEPITYTYQTNSAGIKTVTEVTLQYNDLINNLDENIALFCRQTSFMIDDLYDRSTLEQERMVHDRLADQVTYQAGCPYNQSAFSALCLGESVCAGYARAYQYLMNILGVSCTYCFGTSYDIEKGEWVSHAWNIIKLGDSYYNMDVTWADTVLEKQNMICYTYYNITDSELSVDHKRDEKCEFLPTCDSTEYSFENIYHIPAALGCLSQAGYDLSQIPIVYSLDDFYYWMREFMISSGTGDHTFLFVAYGDECSNQIIAQENFNEGYLTDVVAALGMNGYQYNFSVNSTDLTKGYYYVTMDVSLY